MGKVNLIELKIPNLGEAEETEIIEVNVTAGTIVEENDPLIVLESEKAAMEIPSDYSGKIIEIKVKEGQSVQEGQVYAVIESEEISKLSEDNHQINDLVEVPKDFPKQVNEYQPDKKINLTGINAGPAVRKYARELEIDLSRIQPSGRNGKITKEDLKRYIHSNKDSGFSFAEYQEKDFGEIGDYEIEALSKIRKIGAKNLHQAWLTIPHVTHFEEIEMTNINILKKNKGLSPLSLIAQCFVAALQDFPIFNSSLIKEDKVLIKKSVNLGIAVDTDQGLIVPVIKNANDMSAQEMMENISDLAEKARTKKLLTQHLIGATATISSLGKFGGTGFTPIINPPEVCILAVSRSKKVLGFDEQGRVIEKEILPVSLSYDHRVINGGDAGRFMDRLKSHLENIK